LTEKPFLNNMGPLGNGLIDKIEVKGSDSGDKVEGFLPQVKRSLNLKL
jgi:hypothetical protein